MKKFLKITFFILLITFIACSNKNVITNETPAVAAGSLYAFSNITNSKIVVIDSCEYIQYHTYYYESVTHKGNCKFCAERQRRMIAEELKKYNNEKSSRSSNSR
jgi:hypothetical protein